MLSLFIHQLLFDVNACGMLLAMDLTWLLTPHMGIVCCSAAPFCYKCVLHVSEGVRCTGTWFGVAEAVNMLLPG